MGSNLLCALFQILSIPVLARYLAPGDFGKATLCIWILGFARVFSDLGIHNAIIHFQKAGSAELSSLFWISQIVGILAFLGCFLASPAIVGLFPGQDILALLRLSFLGLLLAPAEQFFLVLAQRKLAFATLARVDVLAGGAGAISTVLLAIEGRGGAAIIAGFLISTGLRALFLVWAEGKSWMPEMGISIRGLGAFFRFGAFQTGERLLRFISHNLDQLLIGRFLGDASLGLYSMAQNVVSKPFAPAVAIISRVLVPFLSRIQDDDSGLKRSYFAVLRIQSIIFLPLYTGIFVSAPGVVPILLGKQWVGAVPIIRILSLLGILTTLGSPLGSFLIAKGRSDIGFYMNFLGFLFFPAGIMVGFRFGLTGVALALLLSTLLVMVPLDFIVRKKVGGMTIGEFSGTLFRTSVCTIVFSLYLEGILHLYQGIQDGLFLGLLLASGLGLYVTLIFRAEKEFLLKGWEMVRGSF